MVFFVRTDVWSHIVRKYKEYVCWFRVDQAAVSREYALDDEQDTNNGGESGHLLRMSRRIFLLAAVNECQQNLVTIFIAIEYDKGAERPHKIRGRPAMAKVRYSQGPL